MVGEIYIEHYDNHTEVWLNQEKLNREEALETLNDALEAALDDASTRFLANTIRIIEMERDRLA